MSGNLWMFSDMLDDEDIEMQKHDFITLYQGADYYGLGLKSFTRMAREAGAVYKIGKKVLIRRTIFDEYLRKIYKKEMEQKALDDAEKNLVMRQGTMVTDEESGRMDIRFGLMDYYGGLGESKRKNSRIICAALRSDAHKERSSELNCPGDLFFYLRITSSGKTDALIRSSGAISRASAML